MENQLPGNSKKMELRRSSLFEGGGGILDGDVSRMYSYSCVFGLYLHLPWGVPNNWLSCDWVRIDWID